MAFWPVLECVSMRKQHPFKDFLKTHHLFTAQTHRGENFHYLRASADIRGRQVTQELTAGGTRGLPVRGTLILPLESSHPATGDSHPITGVLPGIRSLWVNMLKNHRSSKSGFLELSYSNFQHQNKIIHAFRMSTRKSKIHRYKQNTLELHVDENMSALAEWCPLTTRGCSSPSHPWQAFCQGALLPGLWCWKERRVEFISTTGQAGLYLEG